MADSHRPILMFCLLVICGLHVTVGFAPHQQRMLQPSRYQATSGSKATCILYSTPKKKRRRRKDGSIPTDETFDGDTSSEDGELPDFDLKESNAASRTSRGGTSAGSATTSSYVDPLGEISANMMGSANRPGGAKSVQELLQDRSLERKFEFLDTNTDDSLPDLLPLGNVVSSSDQGLTKRERQAARRLELQNAVPVNEEEDTLKMIVSKLPLIRDEKGNISGVKILENATWVCIYTLIAWEVYLNSPFFDRAAPMAPVVY